MQQLEIINKGMTDYVELWQSMRDWTRMRTKDTIDQCWLTIHQPVFTMGQQADRTQLLTNPQSIPLVHSDRGGQITYHGPGQLMFYFLLNLHRQKLGIKKLIWVVEEAAIRFLTGLDLTAHRRSHMPGVYINQEKIASLGFRVTKGCCYHGISFNHQPDLSYFTYLDTCGYKDLESTSLKQLGISIDQAKVQQGIITEFCQLLCYKGIT